MKVFNPKKDTQLLHQKPPTRYIPPPYRLSGKEGGTYHQPSQLFHNSSIKPVLVFQRLVHQFVVNVRTRPHRIKIYAKACGYAK